MIIKEKDYLYGKWIEDWRDKMFHYRDLCLGEGVI